MKYWWLGFDGLDRLFVVAERGGIKSGSGSNVNIWGLPDGFLPETGSDNSLNLSFYPTIPFSVTT